MEEKQLEKLSKIIKETNNIVFFGGAGVSTESGIPDFRSKDGLYNQKYKYDPEYMLSKDCLEKKPDEFWKFYRDKILIEGILPNEAHKALAKLETEGKLKAIITQNIDNLHELAGSKNIHHIHGTIMTNHCMKCKKEYSLEEILKMDEIPICNCGGIIRPDVTLYGENLPQEAWDRSMAAITKADTLIIAGTSLSVYPAVMLVDYFYGDNLIIINRDTTDRDKWADVVIHDSIGKVLSKVVNIYE